MSAKRGIPRIHKYNIEISSMMFLINRARDLLAKGATTSDLMIRWNLSRFTTCEKIKISREYELITQNPKSEKRSWILVKSK